ncbi:MAG: glycosyltransferase, partial [Bacteroidales bacterium]|nr:glycosyltransferase [Bacteroidales bacterium]
TYYLKQFNNDRNIIIRTHNIEHYYYKYLEKQENNILKKIFFRSESIKLKKYEKILNYKYKIAAISESDNIYFNKNYKNSTYIPAFHKYMDVKCKIGQGEYLLYHGNLSVHENIKSVKFITDKIIQKVPFKLVVAGKKPSNKLKIYLQNISNVELIENPTNKILENLIINSQINILPTFQETGIKLKLLHALFIGRHCLTNNKMVENTGLKELCTINELPNDFINSIKLLMKTPFLVNDITKRKDILINKFSNEQNIKKLINLLNN